jgi:NAD(P)-dependent dehydrogenase (short-subunit alcohol dehydrogenase family)
MATQPQSLPAQHQDDQPGHETQMFPAPAYKSDDYKAADKLKGKVAIITGADSGIGRSVAVTFAKEGANVVMLYLNEHDDAKTTKAEIEKYGGECLCFAGDVAERSVCERAVKAAVDKWGRVDILVNNAGEQHPQERLEDISEEQWEKTFHTNIFAMFQLTKVALLHMREGSTIINTSSITAFRGSAHLLDYSSTKGAITAFTRSLAMNLAGRGIRVNSVAPGPIWTPLIPSTFDEEEVAKFGANTTLGRPGQPEEVAPAYVYLACNDSSYVTGQTIHVNGGTVING